MHVITIVIPIKYQLWVSFESLQYTYYEVLMLRQASAFMTLPGYYAHVVSRAATDQAVCTGSRRASWLMSCGTSSSTSHPLTSVLNLIYHRIYAPFFSRTNFEIDSPADLRRNIVVLILLAGIGNIPFCINLSIKVLTQNGI